MNFQEDINSCLHILESGGTILYPTDTVWGIGCDATNEAAVEKIFSIKKRNEEKSMIILLADEKDILQYTNHPNAVIFDYIKGIHKPTTVIYDGAKNLAKNLVNKDGSVGIRIVKDEFCATLLKAFGKPVVSTSSNISGYPAPSFFEDIDGQIKSGVDYIVQHRREDLTPASPSTVIKLDKEGG
ncbi:MAG: threonylcarbamoyl-AMP synthase, partial [Sphingobacteriales bacterium]